MNNSCSLRRTLALATVLACTAAQADTVNFPKGSLIIPEQANFQTPCGSLAAYGLAYRLLLANQPGGYFATGGRSPITLYWAVGGNKTSPNRCVPTNLSTPPSGAWNQTGSPSYNDGCDFKISSGTGQPVTAVDYSLDPFTTGTADGIFPIVTVPMRTPTVVGADTQRKLGTTNYIQLDIKSPAAATFDAATMALGVGSPSFATSTKITLSGTNGGNNGTVKIEDDSGTNVATVKADAAGVWSVTVTLTKANYMNTGPGVVIPNTQIYFTLGGTSVDYNGNGSPEAIPAYTKVMTLDTIGGFTTVQYLGGPFIIHQTDVKAVLDFLRNGDASTSIATGATGAIPARTVNVLSEFTANNASYATLKAAGYFDACTGPKLTVNGVMLDATSPGTAHYVNMHQALVPFQADVSRRINAVPPKIALLNSNSNGDNSGGKSVSGLLILDSYLANAGLFLTKSTANVDSGGCPVGTISTCATNGGKSGFIYDNFDADADLVPRTGHLTGTLGDIDATTTKNIYGVMWSPHWETKNNTKVYSTQVGTGSGTLSMNNIAAFLDLPGKGLMGACASIGSYEGSGNITAFGTPATNFNFSGALETNGLSKDEGSWEGMNCTDPNYPNNLTAACTTISGGSCISGDTTNLKECLVWANTTSEFGQIGDYHFVQTGGTIDDYKPASGTTYNTATRRLATTWTKYNPGDYPSGGPCDVKDPNCDNGWDIITVGSKNNDPTKGTIVYVAGHDYQISTVGSRIILNSLLNLGQDPHLVDRSISMPMVYEDPNGAFDKAGTTVAGPVPLLFSGVYDLTTGVSNTRFTYTWSNGSQWLFPKIPGNLYERPLVQVGAVMPVAVGVTQFNESVLYDAAGQLATQYAALGSSRNLFTYVGGRITGGPYPNGALQTGWVPVPIQPSQVDAASCVDVLQWGKVTDPVHGPYFGLQYKSVGDGVCDLNEATQLVLPNPGTDFGVLEANANKAMLNSTATVNAVKGLIQVVQGSCFATTTKNDGSGDYTNAGATTNCNGWSPRNRPVLGGILHSTPAIISPSPRVSEVVPRPTVAYFTAADGQLHAFYVSGGAGYKGPTGLSFPNPGAATVFPSAWPNPLTTPPKPLSELWSFMPASQLPLLATNNQLVDSAPVVQDVFGDFSGSGVREWHTVLVATAGGPLGNPGSEIFAMDITNPLKPVLLWDLMGTWTGPTNTVSPIALANIPAGTYSGATAFFNTKPGAGYPTAGVATAGVYDYSTLGASYGLSLGVVRTGTQPTFPVFVSTNFNSDTANSPLNNGAQVYSVDSATGQIIWHWVEPYAVTGSIPGNPVPQPLTLLPDQYGGVNLVYVTDHQGKVWELPAGTGINGWAGKGVSNTGAIFSTGTAAEPLTTPITIALLPNIAAAVPTPVLKPWSQKLVGLVGTDSSPDSFVNPDGQFHVMNVDLTSRPVTGIAPADTTLTLTPFPYTFTGQRVTGSIAVTGTRAYVTTVSKPLTDPLLIDETATGGLYPIDLNTVGASSNFSSVAIFSSQASYAGVMTWNDKANSRQHVFASDVSQSIHYSELNANIPTAVPQSSLSVNGATTGILYRITGMMRRFLN